MVLTVWLQHCGSMTAHVADGPPWYWDQRTSQKNMRHWPRASLRTHIIFITFVGIAKLLIVPARPRLAPSDCLWGGRVICNVCSCLWASSRSSHSISDYDSHSCLSWFIFPSVCLPPSLSPSLVSVLPSLPPYPFYFPLPPWYPFFLPSLPPLP